MSHPFQRQKLIACILLALITLAAFWQVQDYEFVDYDDNMYVFENTHIQSGLTSESITWAFSTLYFGNWCPLTWLSYMFDYQLYGLNAGGYHLTNLMLHIINTILLFLVFNRMTGAFWKSAFIAALFSLHPLHVESVAWISDRKDLLCTSFWILTMWAYARYTVHPTFWRYLSVFLLLALGLMSKATIVTLPFVLLLMDYWPLGRFKIRESLNHNESQTHQSVNIDTQKSITFHLILEKIPFLALAISVIILTLIAQQKIGAVKSFEFYPLTHRFANALMAYIGYIGKTIWPHNLAFFYPYPDIIPNLKTVWAGLLLIFISFLVIWKTYKYPYLAFGWLWYLGTLIPVIGLVQIGAHAMADRYSYTPIIGLFVIIAWGIPDVLKTWVHRKLFFVASAISILSVLMICSRLQLRSWANSTTLFEHAIEVTRNNYKAHHNLGVVLTRQKKHEKAILHYYEAIRIKPDFAKAHYNLGVAFAYNDKFNEAITHFSRALLEKPDYFEAHCNLGVALAAKGLKKKAVFHFSEAIRIKDDYAEAHYNLGNVLAEQEKIEKAILHYNKALQINPDNAGTHYNLANALAAKGNLKGAALHYLKALYIEPDSAEIHNNIGTVLIRQGKIKKAIIHFSKALEIKPDFLDAQKNLKLTSEAMGSSESN